MPSKYHDMVELDSNEYIFGEEGGRGTPASVFFKKIANMSQKSSKKSKPKPEPSESQQITVGAGRSHAEHISAISDAQNVKKKGKKKQTSSERKQEHKSSSGHAHHLANMAEHNDSSPYFDLDDDWDTNFESTIIPKANARIISSSNTALSKPEPSEIAAKAERDELNSLVSRILKFQTALSAPTVDIDQLRNLSWSGVPPDLRPRTWMHLLGYLPSTAERREKTLAKKRLEYFNSIEQEFGNEGSMNQSMWHQIAIDVPRTNPHIKLYSFESTRRSLERILYLWSVRHPASGYVQGINDLLTPFFQTFLTQYVGTKKVEDLDPQQLTKEELDFVEADSYWCLSKLLDGIQDNYIHAQPGIHRQVQKLEKLMTKVNSELIAHFKSENVEFMQFSFRWMNCLLMREVPMTCAIRIWDTYLSEGPQKFSDFHVYVCAAFLQNWAKDLVNMEFQDLIIFLQSPPTQDWTEKDIELILSQAFMYQSVFKDSMKQ